METDVAACFKSTHLLEREQHSKISSPLTLMISQYVFLTEHLKYLVQSQKSVNLLIFLAQSLSLYNIDSENSAVNMYSSMSLKYYDSLI